MKSNLITFKNDNVNLFVGFKDISKSTSIPNTIIQPQKPDSFQSHNNKDKSKHKIAEKKVAIYAIFGAGILLSAAVLMKRKSLISFFSNSTSKKTKPSAIDIRPNHSSIESSSKTPEKNIVSDIKSNQMQDDLLKEASNLVDKDEEFLKNTILSENDRDRLNYFQNVIFENMKKSEESAFDGLNKFEKYGLDLNINKENSENIGLKSKDNITFFKVLPLNASDELINRACEVFDKYTKINPGEVSEKLIQKVFFPWDVKNIKSAIEKTENPKVKNDLLQLLDERINVLHTGKYRKNLQSFLNTLEKYIYPAKNISAEKRADIIKKYGENYGENYINTLSHPISGDEALNLAHLAASNDGKYFDFCKDNLETLVLLNNAGSFIGVPSRYCKMGNLDSAAKKDLPISHYLETVVNSVNKFLKEDNGKNEIDALIEYSNMGKYDTMNGILRFNNQIDSIVESLRKNQNMEIVSYEIDNLKQILDKIFNLGSDIDEGFIFQAQFKSKLDGIIDYVNKKESNSSELSKRLKDFKDFVASKYNGSEIQTVTDTLTKVLNTKIQETGKPVLIRNEHAVIFDKLFINDKRLSELMYDSAQTETVLKYLQNEKPQVKQSAFTSTSIYPYETLSGTKVKWNLQTDENSRGFYIEDIRRIFEYSGKKDFTGTEAEIVFAPNAVIKITDAKYIKNQFGNGQYHISGVITHET